MNKKNIITALLAIVAMAGQGQVKCHIEGNTGHPEFTGTLRGYLSGVIDEYHFHAGKAVVKGRFVNRTEHSFSTFNVTGTDLFSNQDFVNNDAPRPSEASKVRNAIQKLIEKSK